MTTPIIHQKTTLVAYCRLMEELKLRHGIVREIVESAKRGHFLLYPSILGELCFLQLRMICELIALGCLLIHGDIPAARTKKIQKESRADWIISRLEMLHPSFYPKPSDQILDENGKVAEIRTIDKPYLTKEELLKLHWSCGEKLHRGTLKTVMNSRSFDLAQVTVWLDKITALLNHHTMPSVDGDRIVMIMMRAKGSDKVHAFAAARVSE